MNNAIMSIILYKSCITIIPEIQILTYRVPFNTGIIPEKVLTKFHQIIEGPIFRRHPKQNFKMRTKIINKNLKRWEE